MCGLLRRDKKIKNRAYRYKRPYKIKMLNGLVAGSGVEYYYMYAETEPSVSGNKGFFFDQWNSIDRFIHKVGFKTSADQVFFLQCR